MDQCRRSGTEQAPYKVICRRGCCRSGVVQIHNQDIHDVEACGDSEAYQEEKKDYCCDRRLNMNDPPVNGYCESSSVLANVSSVHALRMVGTKLALAGRFVAAPFQLGNC